MTDLTQTTLAAPQRRNPLTDAADVIERLEALATWHRVRAERAGADWVWEARILAAEQLERRVADLRAQERRNIARRLGRAA